MRKLKLFGYELMLGKNLEENLINEVKELMIEEDKNNKQQIKENIYNIKDSSGSFVGDIQTITEAKDTISYNDIKKILDKDNLSFNELMNAIQSDYSIENTFKENEEMAKDPIVGSAIEMMADDSIMENPITKKIVTIKSKDKKLEQFLNNFLDEKINIEKRIWEWAFEIIKHGDFKLRRKEFDLDGDIDVYYENVVEGYKVSRIEFMGKVLGYLDEEEGDKTLKSPDEYIHFMNLKSPKRKKIKVKVRSGDGKGKEITCYKVFGTSIVDNARYIYRIVKLLDDVLIVSRIGKSSQFNLVKIEVGNSGPIETEHILRDVRRRIEGGTRIKKNTGMQTSTNPITINGNVYLPVREGKGDVTVEPVGDSIDVRSITDIDYFKNKLFATIKVPKAFLGFEEELPGSMGNSSLVKLDIRYSRSVKRVQNILKEGIRDLCNNYLKYRKRDSDINNFEVIMSSVTSAEDNSMIEDLVMRLDLFNSVSTMSSDFEDYIDKGRLFIHLLRLVGIDASEIGSEKLLEILNKEKSKEENNKKSTKKSKKNSGDVWDFDGADERGGLLNG